MNFLQRLFSQPKTETAPSQADIELVESKPEPEQSEPDPPVGLDKLPFGLHVGKLSDIGLERERNEDSFYAVESLMHHDLGTMPRDGVIIDVFQFFNE